MYDAVNASAAKAAKKAALARLRKAESYRQSGVNLEFRPAGAGSAARCAGRARVPKKKTERCVNLELDPVRR